MDVIPAIDLKGGRCVRLFQGAFDRETEYSTDPVAIAKGFEAFGCPRLHLVDLDGARSGVQENRAIVTAIAGTGQFRVQLGGGIRSFEALDAWLAAGVERCVVGSVAVTDPARVRRWLDRAGADRLILALDVRLAADNAPALAIHGWTEKSAVSLWDCVDGYLDAGIRHVLCTDISRDGAMQGPNIDLYREFARRYPGIRLQASGGVRHVGDLEALREVGADAAITGRALLDGRLTGEEIRTFLQGA